MSYHPMRISQTFWKRTDICMEDKAIYTVLRAFQDEDGICEPTIPDLVAATGLSRSGLRLRLLSVQKRGLVDWAYLGNTRRFSFRERVSENGQPAGSQQNDTLLSVPY